MLKRRGECDLAREAFTPPASDGLEQLHDYFAPPSDVVRDKNARHPGPAELALERVRVAKRLL